MPTAFSQAALAEAKRVLSEAETEYYKLNAEVGVFFDQRDALDKKYETDCAQIDRNRKVATDKRNAFGVKLQKARRDYDQMLALSKQG